MDRVWHQDRCPGGTGGTGRRAAGPGTTASAASGFVSSPPGARNATEKRLRPKNLEVGATLVTGNGRVVLRERGCGHRGGILIFFSSARGRGDNTHHKRRRRQRRSGSRVPGTAATRRRRGLNPKSCSWDSPHHGRSSRRRARAGVCASKAACSIVSKIVRAGGGRGGERKRRKTAVRASSAAIQQRGEAATTVPVCWRGRAWKHMLGNLTPRCEDNVCDDLARV